MKMYGGRELQLHAFLTSALDVGKWSASCPGHFTPRKRALNTHLPRASLDMVVKWNIPAHTRYQTSDIQPTAKSLYWLSYHEKILIFHWILFTTISKIVLGNSQPPIQWSVQALFPRANIITVWTVTNLHLVSRSRIHKYIYLFGGYITMEDLSVVNERRNKEVVCLKALS